MRSFTGLVIIHEPDAREKVALASLDTRLISVMSVGVNPEYRCSPIFVGGGPKMPLRFPWVSNTPLSTTRIVAQMASRMVENTDRKMIQ
jgi:hypothetical protein